MPDETLDEAPEETARRRRRRDDVFGDALPSQTRDDSPEAGEPGGDSRDEWYRREVPPHHG